MSGPGGAAAELGSDGGSSADPRGGRPGSGADRLGGDRGFTPRLDDGDRDLFTGRPGSNRGSGTGRPGGAAVARLRRDTALLPALLASAAVAALLTACASAAPPDWQLNAHGAMERAAAAYLTGNPRVEAAEFARARAEVARTGRADLLATLELTRCAWRVASLQFGDNCAGFVPLAADAGPAEQAYARYLSGQGQAVDAALLPTAQRAVAAGTASPATLAAIADPLSRLVAAGAMLRHGTADPDVLLLAADTASAQGWSRPLLAWLQALRLRAEAAGDADAAARLHRRIAQVVGPVAAAASAASAATR